MKRKRWKHFTNILKTGKISTPNGMLKFFKAAASDDDVDGGDNKW